MTNKISYLGRPSAQGSIPYNSRVQIANEGLDMPFIIQKISLIPDGMDKRNPVNTDNGQRCQETILDYVMRCSDVPHLPKENISARAVRDWGHLPKYNLSAGAVRYLSYVS